MGFENYHESGDLDEGASTETLSRGRPYCYADTRLVLLLYEGLPVAALQPFSHCPPSAPNSPTQAGQPRT